MTPQLQQAIRLLQLSTVELQTEIQEALESNPMLEENAEENKPSDDSASSEQREAAEKAENVEIATEANAEFDMTDSATELQSDSMPAELPVDSSWEDTYDYTAAQAGSTYTSTEDGLRDYESKNTSEDTLSEHLTWQMELTPFSDIDRIIASSIIDSIADDGYLGCSTEDIWDLLKDQLEIEHDEVEAVLHRIQNFDPPGVAARDLQESLILQLKQIDSETPCHGEATLLLKDYFNLLANRDFNMLMRRMKISEEKLKDVIELIHSLNPRPGNQIVSGNPEYIVPDVYVRKDKTRWTVSLNPDSTPKLSINSVYAGLIQRADKSPDNTYMQGQLQEARWLIKSLHSRNETLMKVSTCIVERQKGFLEHGEEAMKALVLHDVAEEVGMHESTISRITNKKYMHTPRGIFELKYFFSSHVSTASGGECSSTAIRALIKKLIAAEEPKKPLSDSKIAKILSDQGINVARRTVAKYRDAMTIPPSNERKRLA